jgi:hypothetical protein
MNEKEGSIYEYQNLSRNGHRIPYKTPQRRRFK